MAHGEWVGNLGYCAFASEATVGAAVTPTVFTLLDNETMTTSYNLEDNMPVAGTPVETFQVLPGLRDHKGDVEIVAEPDTALQVVDMLLKRGSSSGSGPYTWPFTLDGNTAPNSKTMDISTGNVVKRFVGVQASKLTPVFNKNQINLKVSVSALGSFQGSVLAGTPTGSGPYTVALDTTYDTNPTGKLTTGDLIRFYNHTTFTTTDATIASIVDASHITTSTNVLTYGAGDMMYLRPATIALTTLPPFLWSNTQFCFGSTASAALSATQTRLESGTSWEVDYDFESDSGSQRSGSADPASLPRTVSRAALTVKKFFDTPDDIINFNQQNKTACVVRHFSYSGGQAYELRITFNNLKTEDPLPKLKAKSINYAEIKYHTQFDSSDAQEYDIKVLSGLNAIG